MKNDLSSFKENIEIDKNNLKIMQNDLSKIYDKLTFLDLDKLSKEEFKVLKKSLEELVNLHQTEMEDLRT